VTVPFIDLRRQYAAIAAEVEPAVRAVLAGGQYILGAEVQAFEAELAAYGGAAHGIGVASGTDALRLALEAAGVGPGDEVILPAFTFVATAEVVTQLGAVPVQLPPTEIAPAFQGGQIDCACGPLIWLRDYALWDVAKSVVDAPFGVYGGLGTLTFNVDTFASFTASQRAAMLKLMPDSVVNGTRLSLRTAD